MQADTHDALEQRRLEWRQTKREDLWLVVKAAGFIAAFMSIFYFTLVEPQRARCQLLLEEVKTAPEAFALEKAVAVYSGLCRRR